MSNSWRPDNWRNPCPSQETDYASGVTFIPQGYGTFEAGASAMLEALRNQGRDMGSMAWAIALTKDRNPRGVVVFIPDD